MLNSTRAKETSLKLAEKRCKTVYLCALFYSLSLLRSHSTWKTGFLKGVLIHTTFVQCLQSLRRASGAEGRELDRTRGGSGKIWGSSWSLRDANSQAALGKAKVQPCYCKTRKKTFFTLELHTPWRTNSCEYSFQYQRHGSNTLAGCYHHGIHANSCGASTTIAQLFKLFLPSVQLGWIRNDLCWSGDAVVPSRLGRCLSRYPTQKKLTSEIYNIEYGSIPHWAT